MGTTKPRLCLTLTDELYEMVKQYAKQNGILSLSRAITELLEIGLAQTDGVEARKLSGEARRIAEQYDSLNRNSRMAVSDMIDLLAAKDAAIREDSSSTKTG